MIVRELRVRDDCTTHIPAHDAVLERGIHGGMFMLVTTAASRMLRESWIMRWVRESPM